MKKISFILFLIFSTTMLFAQQEGIFIGIYKTGNRAICNNYEIVQKKIPLSESDNLYKEFKKEHPGSTAKIIRPTKSAIVYSFEANYSGFTCHPICYVIIEATTIDDCKKELEQLIEIESKKEKSEYHTQPKIIAEYEGRPAEEEKKTNSSSSTKVTTITKNYNGVNSMYKIVKSDNKSFIFTQFKNTTAKYAVIVLHLTDGTIEKIVLEPNGATINKNFNTDKIDVQVDFQEKQKEKPNLDLIKFMKEKVRQTIIKENGSLKTTEPNGVTGVRG